MLNILQCDTQKVAIAATYVFFGDNCVELFVSVMVGFYMTTEVAILNPIAVVLAADSALTVRRGQNKNYYHGVNKIFGLNTNHPVAFMIYGEPNFMGIPWDTIMKSFRDKIGRKPLAYLDEYCGQFFSFVQGFIADHSEDVADYNSYLDFCETICLLVAKRAVKSGRGRFDGGAVKKRDVLECFREKIAAIVEKIEKFCASYTRVHIKNSQGADWDAVELKLREAFEGVTMDIVNSKFSAFDADVDPNIRNRICNIIIKMCSIGVGFREISGIVVAGFGSREVFPRIVSYSVCTYIGGSLIYFRKDSVSIGREVKAAVVPFGNTDVIDTFLHGISDHFRDEFAEDVMAFYKKKNGGRYVPKRNDFDVIADDIQNKWKGRLYETLSLLPKQTLADLAENLISISAMRTSIYDADGATGGPSSVAVISKGDGLVWIRRQNYFSPELNQHFLARYATPKSGDA